MSRFGGWAEWGRSAMSRREEEKGGDGLGTTQLGGREGASCGDAGGRAVWCGGRAYRVLAVRVRVQSVGYRGMGESVCVFVLYAVWAQRPPTREWTCGPTPAASPRWRGARVVLVDGVVGAC